jgi:hypothetical protein
MTKEYCGQPYGSSLWSATCTQVGSLDVEENTNAVKEDNNKALRPRSAMKKMAYRFNDNLQYYVI